MRKDLTPSWEAVVALEHGLEALELAIYESDGGLPPEVESALAEAREVATDQIEVLESVLRSVAGAPTA